MSSTHQRRETEAGHREACSVELVWDLKTPVLTEALQAIPLRGGSASKDECGPVASGLSFSEKRLSFLMVDRPQGPLYSPV